MVRPRVPRPAPAPPAPRRRARTTVAAAALAVAGVLPVACGVSRTQPLGSGDPAALPNLRRASEALQERIAREKEHVTSLNRQLEELRATEARVYADLLAAEETFQRLRADADGARADVDAVRQELSEVARALDEARAAREAARAERAALEAEVEAERAKGLEVRREIEFWRGGVDATGEVTAFRRRRLEEFRRRWEIPEDTWAELMGDLGLSRVLIGPEGLQPPPPDAPLPPDSLPPPEGYDPGPAPGEAPATDDPEAADAETGDPEAGDAPGEAGDDAGGTDPTGDDGAGEAGDDGDGADGADDTPASGGPATPADPDDAGS